MKKEHMKIINDTFENLSEAKSEYDEIVTKMVDAVDKEIESIGNIKEELDEEFEEMSEKQQESEKGEKLQEIISVIENIANELDNLKEAFETDPFDEAMSSLKDIIGNK